MNEVSIDALCQPDTGERGALHRANVVDTLGAFVRPRTVLP